MGGGEKRWTIKKMASPEEIGGTAICCSVGGGGRVDGKGKTWRRLNVSCSVGGNATLQWQMGMAGGSGEKQTAKIHLYGSGDKGKGILLMELACRRRGLVWRHDQRLQWETEWEQAPSDPHL